MVIALEEPFYKAGFNRTPLAELSVETRKLLACMLNRKKVLRSETGYQRDWRGIAALAGQFEYVDEFAMNMPMDLVLNSWIQNNPETADIGHLEEFLSTIDRWDVLDDLREILATDTNHYILKQQQLEQLPVEPEIAALPVEFQETYNNSFVRSAYRIDNYYPNACVPHTKDTLRIT